MTNSFLPEKYEVPDKPTNFTKLTEGVHRLRILTSPLLGWEVWTDNGDKRGVQRYAYDEPHPANAKHIWAMVVWNFDAGRIQIFSVSQSSIQTQLKALASNPDWGSPLEYNISITRTGQGLNDTKYRVDGSPTSIGKPIPATITKAFKEANISLEGWLRGEDQFGASDSTGKTLDEVFPDRDDTVDAETAEVDDLPF